MCIEVVEAKTYNAQAFFFLCYCSQYLWGKSIGQCSCHCLTRSDQRGEAC